MIGVCSKWSLEELCSMTEDDMDNLLRSYGPNITPEYETVRLMKGDEDPNVVWTFDGSFGFAA